VTVRLAVDGLPPARSEASSVLGESHPHRDRVRKLLGAAQVADLGDWDVRTPSMLELEVMVRSPARPPSDATDFLGGIADVLEDKSRRGPLEHLGRLASVSLYPDAAQIQEVHYQWVEAEETGYTVMVRLR